jgi:hypothetical protein
MDKFITIYFTVIFTLCVAAGAQLTETWVAYIIVGMMIGIFLIIPATGLYDKFMKHLAELHHAQHTRQRVGIYPYDDWK